MTDFEPGSMNERQTVTPPVLEGKTVPQWLGLTTQAEVDGVTDPKLRSAIKYFSRIPELMLNPEVVRERYLKIIDDEEIDESQADQLLAALASKAGELQEKAALAQAAIFKESSSQELSTYEVFVNAEFIQQPISLQVDTFPPQWFRKLSSERQQEIRTRIKLANGAFVKRRVADLDGEKAKNNDYLSLTEREFGLIYEMPGGREAMETYVETFLEGYRQNGTFFWRLKTINEDGKEILDPEIKDKLNNMQGFQEEVTQKLLRKGLVRTITDARAAVAASWNFLFLGNVIESADIDRRTESSAVFGEQVRTLMHPLAKAKGKYIKGEELRVGTEEGWGGPIGDWLADRLTYDPDFRRRFIAGEIRPFPERMFASLPETTEVTVIMPNGKEKTMSMAQALSQKRKIKTTKTESDIFGGYCDTWDSAFKVYNYALGKVPLQPEKNLGEWARTLADAIAKLRGKRVPPVDGDEKNFFLRPYYNDADLLFWIIANSIGLRMYTSETLLNLFALEASENTYDIVLRAIVDYPRLVENASDRKQLKKRFFGDGFGSLRKRILIEKKRISESSKRGR